jgi:putative DNA primase/helicase
MNFINDAEITPTSQDLIQEDQRPDAEVIEHLAKLNSIEYDRQREAQAKTLGVRASTLDKEVRAVKGSEKEAGRLPFANIEPYPCQIEPSQLLDEVSSAIRQFIVLDEHQAHAAALWCALTYFIEVVEVSPLAIINAPEKSCGKTQLLTVMGRLSHRPLPASNASASALIWTPRLLQDKFSKIDVTHRDHDCSHISGLLKEVLLPQDS